MFNVCRDTVHVVLSSMCAEVVCILASFPGLRGGEGKAWYALFAHAR